MLSQRQCIQALSYKIVTSSRRAIWVVCTQSQASYPLTQATPSKQASHAWVTTHDKPVQATKNLQKQDIS